MNWLLYTVIAIFVFSAFFFASWQKHRILRALKQYREGLEKLFSKAEPYYPGFAFRMKLIRWLSKGEYENALANYIADQLDPHDGSSGDMITHLNGPVSIVGCQLFAQDHGVYGTGH